MYDRWHSAIGSRLHRREFMLSGLCGDDNVDVIINVAVSNEFRYSYVAAGH